MNAQLLQRLRERNLSIPQMNLLATKAVARCAANKASDFASRYARDCLDWSRKISGSGPQSGMFALEACLRFAESSQVQEADAKALLREAKWLEGVAAPFLKM